MKVRETIIREEVDNRQKYFLDRAQRQNNKEQTINAIKKYKNDEFKMGKTQTIQNDSYKKEFLHAVKKHNEDKYK
jgi:glycerol-3-phosphate cytidylyltransferase-like family protein